MTSKQCKVGPGDVVHAVLAMRHAERLTAGQAAESTEDEAASYQRFLDLGGAMRAAASERAVKAGLLNYQGCMYSVSVAGLVYIESLRSVGAIQ